MLYLDPTKKNTWNSRGDYQELSPDWTDCNSEITFHELKVFQSDSETTLVGIAKKITRLAGACEDKVNAALPYPIYIPLHKKPYDGYSWTLKAKEKNIQPSLTEQVLIKEFSDPKYEGTCWTGKLMLDSGVFVEYVHENKQGLGDHKFFTSLSPDEKDIVSVDMDKLKYEGGVESSKKGYSSAPKETESQRLASRRSFILESYRKDLDKPEGDLWGLALALVEPGTAERAWWEVIQTILD